MKSLPQIVRFFDLLVLRTEKHYSFEHENSRNHSAIEDDGWFGKPIPQPGKILEMDGRVKEFFQSKPHIDRASGEILVVADGRFIFERNHRAPQNKTASRTAYF